LESLKNGLYLFFYTIYKFADIQNLNSIPGKKKNGPDLGDLRPLHTGPAQIRARERGAAAFGTCQRARELSRHGVPNRYAPISAI
jgi:hypothetical protein